MNIQRFYAATSREALAKARMTFGEGTLILSNRQTANGVEVVATTEDALAALDHSTPASPAPRPSATPRPPAPAPQPRAQPQAQASAQPQTPVIDDAAQLAMSTLSFQDYVRERMLQRRQETFQGKGNAASLPMPAAPIAVAPPPLPAAVAQPRQPNYAVIPPDPEVPERRIVVPATPARTPAAAVPAAGAQQGLVKELHAMRELIEERFSTMAWLGQAKHNPVRAHLTLKLIRSGYSPALARAVLSMLPDDAKPAEAMQWMMGVLERNIKTDIRGRALHDEGGIFALVGTTGVGKTTTVAKLAALCARAHGAASVGLITLDSYRIGAHEHLRAYGRMLGVVTHMANDRAALHDLLGLLSNKKLILVDTTGVAPRDPRKNELLDLLDLPMVKRLLVLNAASHGDTQDETVASFRASGAQQVVLTKLDEAVKLGPVLDSAIRHQLVLRGVSNGQRVPEDWERAHAASLVRQSMRSPGKSAFEPEMNELGFYFAQPGTMGGLRDARYQHA